MVTSVHLNVTDETLAKLKEVFGENVKSYNSLVTGAEMFVTVPVTLYITGKYQRNRFLVYDDAYENEVLRLTDADS